MPSKVCYEFEALRTCKYGAKCKFSHAAAGPIPRASIAMQRIDETRMTKSRFLMEYFEKYDGFEYNSSKPATSEFRRLCKIFGWDRYARERATESFRDALVQEFNAIYGTNEDSIRSWQTLCRVVGVAPIPKDIGVCRRVISAIQVNLIDLVNPSATITLFPTLGALAEYTKASKKYFPLGQTRAGGFLQYLLRRLKGMNPEKSAKSRRSRRKSGRPGKC